MKFIDNKGTIHDHYVNAMGFSISNSISDFVNNKIINKFRNNKNEKDIDFEEENVSFTGTIEDDVVNTSNKKDELYSILVNEQDQSIILKDPKGNTIIESDIHTDQATKDMLNKIYDEYIEDNKNDIPKGNKE